MDQDNTTLLETKKTSNKKVLLILAVILLLASFLRFFNLTAQDMVIDDSLNSFRAIGYFDYLAAENTQSTPVTWFENKQWWQSLSFHDHPPVNFIIQFIFFKIFGVSVLAARLPFALAGLLSVLLLYLVGSKLFNDKVGLLSAALLAVINYHVWISRIGYIESLVIFFILASLYFFILAEKNNKHYLTWGLFLGLGIATKYTILFLIPVYLFYLLFFRRKEFKNKYLYLGTFIILIILLPIIIYNTMVYIERGHFDAALSSMVGMHPEDYKSIMDRAPGKGTPLSTFVTLNNLSSIPFLAILSLATIFLFIISVIRKKVSKGLVLTILYLFFSYLMLYLLAGDDRFVSIITPATTLLISIGLVGIFTLLKKYKLISNIFLGLLVLFIIYEAFFSFNTQNVIKPVGKEKLFYASHRPKYLGYHQLDEYLNQILEDKYSDSFVTFYEVPQVIKKQKKIFEKKPTEQDEVGIKQPIFIYDDRIDWFAGIWLFERRKLYDLRVMGTFKVFKTVLAEKGEDFFSNLGFTKAYFIFAKDQSVITTDDEEIDLEIEYIYNNLSENGIKLVGEIKNPFGKLVFEIYEVEL